jgi:hypothetical protein
MLEERLGLGLRLSVKASVSMPEALGSTSSTTREKVDSGSQFWRLFIHGQPSMLLWACGEAAHHDKGVWQSKTTHLKGHVAKEEKKGPGSPQSPSRPHPQ